MASGSLHGRDGLGRVGVGGGGVSSIGLPSLRLSCLSPWEGGFVILALSWGPPGLLSLPKAKRRVELGEAWGGDRGAQGSTEALASPEAAGRY